MRAVLGALVLALALGAPPAQAVTSSGSVTGIDGVLYDDCRSYPYAYAVEVPGDAVQWRLDVRAVGSEGLEAASDLVTTGAPESGRGAFRLCRPTDAFGTYRIRATFEWQGVDDVWHPATLPDAYFTMRRPATRTALTVSTRRPAYGQRVTYRIRTWDERPGGYHPTAFAWVHLQKRVDGRWVKIRNSRTLTHDTGRVSLRLPYRHHRKTVRIRAVTERTDRWARSFSTPVRLW